MQQQAEGTAYPEEWRRKGCTAFLQAATHSRERFPAQTKPWKNSTIKGKDLRILTQESWRLWKKTRKPMKASISRMSQHKK